MATNKTEVNKVANTDTPQNDREWELWKKAYKEGWNDRGNSPFPVIPYSPVPASPYYPGLTPPGQQYPTITCDIAGLIITTPKGDYTLHNQVSENDGF
jgi:hypothetical protein